MAKVKIVLNSAGVRELLHSREIRNACTQQARQIRDRCGDGWETMTHTAPTRDYATVAPATPEARARNLKQNTLLKALK